MTMRFEPEAGNPFDELTGGNPAPAQRPNFAADSLAPQAGQFSPQGGTPAAAPSSGGIAPAQFSPVAPSPQATPAAPSAGAAQFSPTAPAQVSAASAQAGQFQPAAPVAPQATAPASPAAPAAAVATPAKPAVSAPRTGAVSRLGVNPEAQPDDVDLTAALRAMVKLGASDLHLTSGVPPMVRMDGELRPLEGFAVLNPEGLQRTLYSILTQKQREVFEEELELDFSYALVGEARMRVNIYRQRDSVGAAFRIIPYEIKPLEALGIPQTVSKFAHLPRGLVLVTGPTGSGKSTTLASLVDLANRSRSAHIMTVEDPIEFLHRHKRSVVNQREVGADTHSFKNALKHVLRQDPDIILVGEMRDLETISVALTAAETGHLVFATLHTQNAPQTIDRVIDVFPPEQQGQVRVQLATALQGVICQTLLKKAEGSGRAVAVEVMVKTPAIENLIREGKTHQIGSAMQAGLSLGMQTMDQHLAELVKGGAVNYDDALERSQSNEEFNRLVGRVR